MNWEFLKGIVPCGTSYTDHACTLCDFYVLTQNIINFFLFVAAPLATIAAVYIAFLFITSGGSSSKTTEAKDKLWLLVWGIFWIFGSWLVLNTILNIVANKNVFPWPWNKIDCTVSKVTIMALPPISELTEQAIPSLTKLSEEEGRGYLQRAGITINKSACPAGVSYKDVSGGCTSLAGITTLALMEAIELKNDCQCDLKITGGAELGHAQGAISHSSGYKLDFQPNSALDKYIQKNFTYIGYRSDGAKQYKAIDGTIMAREDDHWDATFAQ